MGTYSQAVTEAIKHHGIHHDVPYLLDCWRSLIEDCEDGYAWDVSEYNSELRVRGELETLLNEPTLLSFKEHGEFHTKTVALDSRFRALLHSSHTLPDKETWWQRGVLAAAGPAYVEFYFSAHGFELAIKE